MLDFLLCGVITVVIVAALWRMIIELSLIARRRRCVGRRPFRAASEIVKR